MRAAALALVIAAAACGQTEGASGPPDNTGDGSGFPNVCGASVTISQAGQSKPTAGPAASMRVTSQVSGASGVLSYVWTVAFRGAPVGFTPVNGGTAIDVPVPVAGIYRLTVLVLGAPSSCPPVVQAINVRAPGALSALIRLRVIPPRGATAPVTEQLFDISGGADADLGRIGVADGSVARPTVMGPAGPLAAYLRMSPDIAPDLQIEAFSDATGVATVQLPTAATYSVLVVPSVAGAAPRRFTGWDRSAVLTLDAGVPITGSVRDPQSAPLAGATVQLVTDGVPSVPATTAADGSFALRAAPGASVTVEVTPPSDSGLPRLSATSSGFDLDAPLEVRYAANVMRADLGGIVLRRLGAPLPGARISVVGALAAVGTVATGAQTQVASGAVWVAARADAAGAVPALRVPAAPMSAVIETADGDLAVVALDAAAGAPASLEAPLPQLVTTAVLDAAGAGLPGAQVDLVPGGALAAAGAATLRRTAVAQGVIAVTLPAGGSYQLRFQDPALRAAPLVVAERAITAIAASYRMPATIRLEAVLASTGSLTLSNSVVQVMCTACSGVERAMPLAEVVTDASSRFALAVPDPGTR